MVSRATIEKIPRISQHAVHKSGVNAEAITEHVTRQAAFEEILERVAVRSAAEIKYKYDRRLK